MLQQLISFLVLVTVSTAAYSYSPYITTYNAPVHAQHVALGYASHVPVQHLTAAPVYTRNLYASAPVVAKSLVAAAPVAKTAYVAPSSVPIVRNVEYEGSPRYDFSYGVHDSITGDIKSQVESRNGGNVAGSYSVVDADGFKRTVTYTADDLNGFNAVVQREPILTKLAVARPVVPAVSVPVQQNIQYLPQIPVQQQQQYLPQIPVQQQEVVATEEVVESAVVEQSQQPQLSEPAPEPQQPESEPAPIEYPAEEEQQPQQPQYSDDEQFPPYPQYENPQSVSPSQESDADSDVVEVRTIKDEQNGKQTKKVTSTPAQVAVKKN